MAKVVIDTTVLVSAFLKPVSGGASYDLLRLAETAALDLYFSEDILEEMTDVLLSNRLRGDAKGDGVVGGAHRIVVLEVDLVLADGHLMMAGLDDDAQLLERFDHLLTHVGRLVRRQIEVAGGVVRKRLDDGQGARQGLAEPLHLRPVASDDLAIVRTSNDE